MPLDSGRYPYLDCLNQAQLQAVTASPSTPLQILAGPGSGKTRVLTSRVAYLVQHHGYMPHEIVAVTFTNKSANEMKKRLIALLGPQKADNLVLGTFHSTCAKYLRRFGQLINLPNHFVIADADDCKKIIAAILKEQKDGLAESNITLKEGSVMSEISKAKAKGESPSGMAMRAARDPSSSTSTTSIIAQVYEEYELALREANSLDFDDLLIYALRLFEDSPNILAGIRHILVDEFQDTNITQYALLKCFAKAHQGVSVVGDPDQSIYGWRSAEVENLNKMTIDFPGVHAIFLEENYRSTGSILGAAHAVVSQDRKRIPKNLFTTHPEYTPVTFKAFGSPAMEAGFIATEIKRLVAYTGGLLKYDDFAILLRYNALSRVLESALQKESIPNRIVGGHKFFERTEIKDLLAYLQLADNPNFNPAFMRVVNVPKRAIGDKSLADIVRAAKDQSISPMELCEDITDGGPVPDGIKPGIKRSLATFVGVVRKLRRAAKGAAPVSHLIKMVIEHTGYEEYLRTSQPDFDSRWANVQELITYSVTVAEEQERLSVSQAGGDPGFAPASSAAVEAIVNRSHEEEKEKQDIKMHPFFKRNPSGSKDTSKGHSVTPNRDEAVSVNERSDGVIEILSSDAEEEMEPDPKDNVEAGAVGKLDEASSDLLQTLARAPDNLTPLAYFLQTSMLSTDTDAEQDDGKPSLPKVTIMTVHAAKGLEWPVVFIPAVEQGSYPLYRCTEPQEVAEERRLLYVAMTRAQSILHMSFCQFRMMGGEDSQKEMSEFVGNVIRYHSGLLTTDLPQVDAGARQEMSRMLARPLADEKETEAAIMKHVREAPPLSHWDAPPPSTSRRNRFARREITKATRAAEYWKSDHDEYALPGSSSFASGQPPLGPLSGFTSARTGTGISSQHPPSMVPSMVPPTLPPPKHPARTARPPMTSANKHIPEPLPFTFNSSSERGEKKDESGLGSFMTGGHSSLATMAMLGLPAEASGPGVVLGTPAVNRPGGARSGKRLGMGRAGPWKKPRTDK